MFNYICIIVIYNIKKTKEREIMINNSIKIIRNDINGRYAISTRFIERGEIIVS